MATSVPVHVHDTVHWESDAVYYVRRFTKAFFFDRFDFSGLLFINYIITVRTAQVHVLPGTVIKRQQCGVETPGNDRGLILVLYVKCCCLGKVGILPKPILSIARAQLQYIERNRAKPAQKQQQQASPRITLFISSSSALPQVHLHDAPQGNSRYARFRRFSRRRPKSPLRPLQGWLVPRSSVGCCHHLATRRSKLRNFDV